MKKSVMDIVEQSTLRANEVKFKVPKLTVGDSVNVHMRLQEKDRERIQVFSGTLIKLQGKKSTRSFTVRKISDGVGVERTFPVACPSIDRIEVLYSSKVRRAKLFYLRERKGRAARLTKI